MKGTTSAREALRLRPSLLLSCVSGNPAIMDSLVAFSASPCASFGPVENVLHEPAKQDVPSLA